MLLNENFKFTRPLTITGAFIFSDGTISFQQMVLDRIENDEDSNNAEYIIQNTKGGPLLRIPKTRAYYVNEAVMQNSQTGPNEYQYNRNGEIMSLVNERFGNMQEQIWYLCPQAYSITLIPDNENSATIQQVSI